MVRKACQPPFTPRAVRVRGARRRGPVSRRRCRGLAPAPRHRHLRRSTTRAVAGSASRASASRPAEPPGSRSLCSTRPPPSLSSFCLYSWPTGSKSPPPPAAGDIKDLFSLSGATEPTEDVPVVFPQAASPTDLFFDGLRGALRHQVGDASLLPSWPSAPAVRVVVIDSTPDAAHGQIPEGESRHGDTLAHLIEDVVCDSGQCVAEVTTALALPWTDRGGAGPQRRTHRHASDVARAVARALARWQHDQATDPSSTPPHLLLNMSIGWEHTPGSPTASCRSSTRWGLRRGPCWGSCNTPRPRERSSSPPPVTIPAGRPLPRAPVPWSLPGPDADRRPAAAAPRRGLRRRLPGCSARDHASLRRHRARRPRPRRRRVGPERFHPGPAHRLVGLGGGGVRGQRGGLGPGAGLRAGAGHRGRLRRRYQAGPERRLPDVPGRGLPRAPGLGVRGAGRRRRSRGAARRRRRTARAAPTSKPV